MTEAAYRICPSCREEYRPVVASCPDCDEALVAPEELPEEPVFEFPPASELTCVRVAPLAWIRALSDGLESSGVPHRVEQAQASDAPDGQRAETFGDVNLFALYVLAEDVEATRELDSLIAAQLIPEEAPDVSDGEAEACPACGSVLAHDAVECSDCGLAFG